MGGIERASSTIANYFASKGHQVLYLAIFNHPQFFKLHPKVVYSEPTDGTNVTSLNIYKTITRIRQTVKNNNFDAIVAYNKLYAALTLIATVGLRQKVFISERSSPFYKWSRNTELINRLALFLHPPTGIIAQTIVAAEHQKEYYGDVPICVIPNALRNVELYPEVERQKIILAVGRIDDYLKGFDRLVEAFAICKNDWKLVFAGGDENGSALKLLAEKNGLLDRIQFLGKIKNIDAIYAQASIFVIPSRSEGFPNALCEAMAAGIACISFDFIAGPREIITDGVDGIIVPDGNTTLLAEAIDNLVDNEIIRRRLGENATAIRCKLKEETVGNQFLDFIIKED